MPEEIDAKVMPAQSGSVAGLVDIVSDYLRRCDFHDGRVLSKPMPSDVEVNRMRTALAAYRKENGHE